MLQNYGLPITSALSVLVVEILPTITNIHEAVSNLTNAAVADKLNDSLRSMNVDSRRVVKDAAYVRDSAVEVEQKPSPLSDELGEHRILRTSPLTEVPYVC